MALGMAGDASWPLAEEGSTRDLVEHCLTTDDMGPVVRGGGGAKMLPDAGGGAPPSKHDHAQASPAAAPLPCAHEDLGTHCGPQCPKTRTLNPLTAPEAALL